MKESLTQAELKELLWYLPESGLFLWRLRPLNKCKDCRYWRIWNSRFAGKLAGEENGLVGNARGQIVIGGKRYPSHRLAWLYVYGEWPEHIDHINHDPSDNRLCNLRNVTHKENLRNQSLRTNNSTGVLGVSHHKRGRSVHYRAYISADRKFIHLGYFKTLEDAATARSDAVAKYGFHENHGC